jgi:hypothetical protein
MYSNAIKAERLLSMPSRNGPEATPDLSVENDPQRLWCLDPNYYQEARSAKRVIKRADAAFEVFRNPRHIALFNQFFPGSHSFVPSCADLGAIEFDGVGICQDGDWLYRHRFDAYVSQFFIDRLQ